MSQTPPVRTSSRRLNELVARLVLEDHTRLRLHGAGRDEQQRREGPRQDEPAPSEQHGAAGADQSRARQQGSLGAERRNRHERG